MRSLRGARIVLVVLSVVAVIGAGGIVAAASPATWAASAGVTAAFGPAGAHIATPSGAFALQPVAAGWAGAVRPLPAATLRMTPDRATYHWQDGLQAWYRHHPRGVEQGFTVPRPAGSGTQVRIVQRLSGAVLPVADGDVVTLLDLEGEPVATYSELRVWDADGRPLPSSLQVGADGVAIHVEARDARFPLTVDPLFAQPVQELGPPASPVNRTNFAFGAAVAVQGDTALVGSPGDRTTGTQGGAAHVYARSAGTWSLQTTLLPPQGTDGTFGEAVDLDGDTAIIGAPSRSGTTFPSVYVMVRSGGTWSTQAVIPRTPGLSEFARFGSSVAIDGDTAIIGTPDAGAADAYVRSGTTWQLQANLVSAASDKDRFGASVAVDGDTAVVGTPGDDAAAPQAGRASIFVRTAGAWSVQAELTPPTSPDSDSDGFGSAVALDGDTVAIGAPLDAAAGQPRGSVSFSTRSGTAWGPLQTLRRPDNVNATFGRDVDLAGDVAVVAATDGVGADSMQVLRRTGGVWGHEQTLVGGPPGASFPAVATDGTTAVLGSLAENDIGVTQFWVRPAATWEPQGSVTVAERTAIGRDQFGFSVAVDASVAVVGAIEDDDRQGLAGAAHIFERTASGWAHAAKLLPNTSGRMGTDVDVHAGTVVVGALNSAFVYVKGAGGWEQQAELFSGDLEPGNFGSSVAVHGHTIVVGRPTRDTNTAGSGGGADVFTRTGSTWTKQTTLEPPLASGDALGTAVALDGDTAVIGAPSGPSAPSAGLAHVFTRTGTTWSLQQTLMPEAQTGGAKAAFGSTLALDGDRVMVTAPGDDAAGQDKGATYVFTRAGGTWTREALIGEQSGPVALQGERAVIGASLHERSDDTWPQAGTLPDGPISDVALDGELLVGNALSDAVAPGAGVVTVYALPDEPNPDPTATPSPSPSPTTTAAPVPVPQGVQRLAGRDRIATAVSISQASYGDGDGGAVVLARADVFADALAGTPVAVDRDGPILLTPSTSLDANVLAEIDRVLGGPGDVILLGGDAALAPAVADQLQAAGHTVTRYGGANRSATAVTIATEALGDPQTLLVANGQDFPDAVAAGTAAGHIDGAVLLTAGATMPPETSDYLAQRTGADRFAIGGPATQALPDATPLTGASRFDTAVAVARQFYEDPTLAGIATGGAFADALSGGPLVARGGGPMLLVTPDTLPEGVRTYLTDEVASLDGAWVFGGSNAITPEVEQAVAQIVG